MQTVNILFPHLEKKESDVVLQWAPAALHLRCQIHFFVIFSSGHMSYVITYNNPPDVLITVVMQL